MPHDGRRRRGPSGMAGGCPDWATRPTHGLTCASAGGVALCSPAGLFGRRLLAQDGPAGDRPWACALGVGVGPGHQPIVGRADNSEQIGEVRRDADRSISTAVPPPSPRCELRDWT
jgi:hypothetical protein